MGFHHLRTEVISHQTIPNLIKIVVENIRYQRALELIILLFKEQIQIFCLNTHNKIAFFASNYLAKPFSDG